MNEGAPKFEKERQPSPLTLMRFAHTVEELKKKYLPAKRSADSLIDPEGTGTYIIEPDRVKILAVFYAERTPLDATADVTENLQKIVASASIDENFTDADKTRADSFLLSNGRIGEKISQKNPDQAHAPVIISTDITDEQLNDFIDQQLKPFFEKKSQ